MSQENVSTLNRVRARHAEMLELPSPSPAIDPEISHAIELIDRFLRKGKRTHSVTQKARVARSSLRGILKLL